MDVQCLWAEVNYHLWVYFHLFFPPTVSGGIRNWDIKKPINKISIPPRLTTVACLVYSLVLILREGTNAVLSIPNGSVELVCPSAGVYLELALALIQPVSHLDLVMPKSRFGVFFLCVTDELFMWVLTLWPWPHLYVFPNRFEH